MRRWIILCRFILIALAGPGLAFVATVPIAAQTDREVVALDTLFTLLKAAPNEASARAVTEQIWIYWTTPSEPLLAADMQQVLILRQRADFDSALTLLDRIVVEHPTYAEGWNQRATIHYLLGNSEQSLADIEKVLEFEPRHFGALVGRAAIYKGQGKDALAIKDMVRALAINPFLVERSLFPGLLQKPIAI